MAKGTLFVGWGEGIPGREQKALQVFNETLEYYGQLQQRGEAVRSKALSRSSSSRTAATCSASSSFAGSGSGSTGCDPTVSLFGARCAPS